MPYKALFKSFPTVNEDFAHLLCTLISRPSHDLGVVAMALSGQTTYDGVCGIPYEDGL